MAEIEKAKAEKNVSFSLAGCGFLGIYHIGAAACLREHVPHLIADARFCGASAGALISCGLICDLPLNLAVDFTLRLARSSGQFPLGGWEPSVNIEGILRSSIDQVLPDNAHELCTDRLFVSVTTLKGFKNQIISKFNTRKDLLDALMCSAYVPAFSSYTIPKFGDEYFLDGGLSDNLPVLDANTITICPWAGEHSICPQDPEGQSFPLTMMNMSVCPSTHNLARFKDAFFSPKPETLKNYCWQGYDDALRFLHENHLIHCNVHRVLAVLTNHEHRMSMDCADCEHHRDHARNSRLSSEILAKWDEMDWWGAIPRYTSLVVEPLKKWCRIWLVPVSMLRDCVLQLFMLAYFKVDAVRNGGLSAEVLRLIKKLYKPREFLWELFLFTVTNFMLRAAEYWTRVFSELVAFTDSVRYSRRVVCQQICKQCGLSYDEAPGPLTEVQQSDERKVEEVPAVTSEALPEVVVVENPQEEKEAVPVVVVQDEADVGEEVKPEETEVRGSSLQDAAETMAVWVDIHADSVEMALPLLEEADERADESQSPETVQVEGVGEIKEVVIDPVLVVPAPKAAPELTEGAPKAADRSQQKTERIHQYVHKLESLKSIMTLHYVDENSQRRTESLFVEEMGSGATSEESPHTCSLETAAAAREKSTDQPCREEEEGHSVDPEEAMEHKVHREVKQLLENKLFTGQRQFEKDYETNHQLRLKKKRKREVKKDTGRFSLQLISFGRDPPPTPSPDLSRSSSLRSVSVDDEGDLVRSVSDACTLASSLRKLRKFRDRGAGAESPLCASRGSLVEFPASDPHSDRRKSSDCCSSLVKSSWHGGSHNDLSASTSFQSLQSRSKGFRAPLARSLSDTSEVAASLRLMNALKEDSPVQRERQDSGKRRQIPRVATTPLLPSAEEDGTTGQSSGVSQPSSLPVIPDDLSPERGERGEHACPGPAERRREETRSVRRSSALTRLTSGRSAQHQEVKAMGGQGELKRSHAIRGSGNQKMHLLSSLHKLRAMSNRPGATPLSKEPTALSSSDTTTTTPNTVSASTSSTSTPSSKPSSTS